MQTRAIFYPMKITVTIQPADDIQSVDVEQDTWNSSWTIKDFLFDAIYQVS